MFPPATLISAVIAVKMLRHRIPQRANFRRMLILTFQSNITGIDTTAAVRMYDNADYEVQNLRKASDIISKIADALRAPFCLARAAGVTHLTEQEHYQYEMFWILIGGKTNRGFSHQSMNKR